MRGLVIAGLVVLLAACAGPSATTSRPSGSPPASPSGTATAPVVTASPAPVLGATTGDWTGLRWSAPLVLSDASFIQRIVAFDGQLVALGQVQTPDGSGQIASWRSSDGMTWMPLARGEATFAEAQLADLVATPTRLVAWGTVGQRICRTPPGAAETCGPTPIMIWTSPDAISWTRITDTSTFAGGSILAVADGPRGLVAVGDMGPANPTIWVSNSGATWLRLALPPALFADARFSGVRANTAGYVLAGGTGSMSVSVTGGPAASVTKVAAGWWSADGRTWAKATVTRAAETGSSLGEISVGVHGMVAVGAAAGGKEGSAWTSPDGRTWTPIVPGYFGAPAASPGIPTLPSFTLSDDGNRLLAVGVADQLAVRMWNSFDGIDWQPLPFSGATETIPVWPGDPTRPAFDRAVVVPGGLVVLALPTDSLRLPLWRVAAVPSD